MLEKVTTSTATYSVFSPILFLTRTCCFLPVRIRSLGHNTVISWSWRYYATSVGFFASIMAWIGFGLSRSYSIQDVYDIRLYQMSAMFITILDDSYLLFTFTLATLISPLTFKHFCTYFRCLNKARVDMIRAYFSSGENDAVARRQCQMDYPDLLVLNKKIVMRWKNQADYHLKRQVKNEKKKCSIILLLILTLTVFILGLDMGMWWQHVFSKHINLGLYLLYNLPFYYTYFLVMVIEMNYWYLVQMVNVRLANVNENLAEEYNEYKSVRTKKKPALRLRSEIGSTVSVLKEAPTDPFVRNISTTIKVYQLLYEACQAVNNFYGLNILLVVLGCFIHLLVTPYDLYLELKFKNYTFIFPQICWMISHMLRLFLVVEPCHTAVQGVKRASYLVCQFLSLDLSEDLHLQLETLSTQLFHCPIQYTAYDLVILDRSFLTKITGGVTTYLVILFQFEN